MWLGIKGKVMERQEGIQPTPHHQMKKTIVCLTSIFLVQLAGGTGIPQSANAQNNSEVLGACWTRGATNPKGKHQSEQWAEAQSQLRSNLRREPSLRGQRVTG